jgi:hypothetical protein
MEQVLWWGVVLVSGVAVGFPLFLVCAMRYAEIYCFLCTPKGFIATPIFLILALHILSVVFGVASSWFPSLSATTLSYVILLVESILLAFLTDVIRKGLDPSPFDLEDMKGNQLSLNSVIIHFIFA